MTPRTDRSSDLVRVRHMLEAAEEALKFVKGKKRSSFERDRMLQLAIMKSIEIIGEASAKVSADFKSLHPEIEWAAIIGMRNVLIHAYHDISPDDVWNTVNQSLPILAKQTKAILKS